MVAFFSEKQCVRRILLFVLLFSISFFHGSAQTITNKGPEIGMDEGARVTVLGEDDNNIYFSAVDKTIYICCTTSEAGAYGTDCSCDVVYHYSGEDVQLNSNGKPITESYSPLYGKRDTELQSLLISQNGGLCK